MKRIKIHGQYWTVRIVEPDEMIVQSGCDNVAGLTIPDQRLILIQSDSVNPRVIFHEYWHACFHYLHLGDTDDLELHQIEEILAEFFAHEGEMMVRKAKKLTKDLQKLHAERTLP